MLLPFSRLFPFVALCLFAAVAAEDVNFSRDVRPLLAKHCFACHGPDQESREGELRLDIRANALHVITPGAPDSSEIIARINSDDDEIRMPPPNAEHRLSESDVQLIVRWIREGAAYQKHWSFAPPVRPEIPKMDSDAWASTDIDRLVYFRMQQHGLHPSDDAGRIQWLRRVSLALTGLPPSVEAADRFLLDDSSAAWEKAVDRLLASEAYGEHWARMWLDLARYADTKGYEKDRHRDIWRYRDWVISAFNADVGYDQFTIEQLAGDLLPDRTTDQILATAFHRNTMTNEEGGTDNEEFRVAAVKDRVDTTMQVWMGLTMGCAKCHSHKYDPISIEDYYSLYAVFNQTQDKDTETPHWDTPTAKQNIQIEYLERELASIEKNAETSGESAENARERIQTRLTEIRSSVSKTPVMLELSPGKYRTTRIHVRGNFLDQGESVEPGIPRHFRTAESREPRNRGDVAEWLMHPDNPLTSRVMVNRLWARLFGQGLVETEEDFGTQGRWPSHPELLDWLAVEFREGEWSVKRILRQIVLSRTFRQASTSSMESLQRDPGNRWLARGPRFRLAAEAVRDQALFVSGLLVRKVGGPSVMPPQPGGIWKTTYSGEKWKNATGPDRFRRGLYTYLKRTSPYPAMTTFDAGSGEVCQVRRIRTNTPLQALVVLNDAAYVEAAGALAVRMQQGHDKLRDQIRFGFRQVLIRHPSDSELDRLEQLYQELQAGGIDERLLDSAGISAGDPALVALANVLLNLDETLTRP